MCQVVVVVVVLFLLLLLHHHPLVILCLVVVVAAHCDWLPRPVFVLTFRPASNPSDIVIPLRPCPLHATPLHGLEQVIQDLFALKQPPDKRIYLVGVCVGGGREEGRHWPCSCVENVVD